MSPIARSPNVSNPVASWGWTSLSWGCDCIAGACRTTAKASAETPGIIINRSFRTTPRTENPPVTFVSSLTGRGRVLTVGVLQRVACFLTPADRVQIRPVGLHPIIVLRIPAVEMHLEGKRLDVIKGEHRGVVGHVRGGGGGTLPLVGGPLCPL